jgi:hypothetical protein
MSLVVEEGLFRQFSCPCCGNIENLASGRVNDARATIAGYRAAWTNDPHEEERVVMLAIAISSDEDPERRTLVTQLRHAGMRVALSALDAADFNFYPDDFGEPLSRDEALARSDIDHLWEIADTIIEQDTRVDGACQWMVEASLARRSLHEPGTLDLQEASFPYGEL